MKILRKITVKTVLGAKVEGFDKDEPIGTEKTVLTVWGRADESEKGTNTLPNGDVSEFTRFRGAFAAKAGKLSDEAAEEHQSGVMILPEVAGNILAAQLEPADVASVQFGFEINVRKNDSPIGYEYLARPLIEGAATDPLAAIRSQLVEALPAPKPAAKGKKD